MEIYPQFFAQRVAMLAISDRLRARSDCLERVAQARIRQQSIMRAMPRG